MEPDILIKKINEKFDIDITKPSKKREVVFSRYVFFEKLRNSHKKLSMHRIGSFLNVSHATVSTGLQRCEELEFDRSSEFLQIKKQINELLN